MLAENLLETEAENAILCRGPGQTDEVYRLRVVAQSLQQAFERYYIAIEIGRATSELQSLMRISYAVFCLKKKTNNKHEYTEPCIIHTATCSNNMTLTLTPLTP